MIQSASIHYGLCRIVTAEYDEQVRNHSGLLVVIQFYDVVCRQLVERHLHHADSTFYNLLTSSDDC